ncbi:MAG: hypothetical protein IKP35_04790 [Alphaproteobacteria bacterium]|nr:hypothetical protein [Alphaproteobacteria bacterium]
MEHIKDLSGHSGCVLGLYKENDNIFLRKSSGDKDYNKRLKSQCLKQCRFRLDKIKTPEVYRYGIGDDGLFYFDMEFVNGVTCAQHMNYIKIKDIVNLIDLLFEVLPVDNSYPCDIADQIFKNKIKSLHDKWYNYNSCVKSAFDKLENFDFKDIPLSTCCGDLTLENIILSSSGIYVIDLLDSFYNSWMIDVAKLLQDIDLGWSYRHQKRDFNLNLRLATAKQAIFDKILALPDGKKILTKIYHILLLNVLRIYPYAKDEETFKFLDNATEQVIKTIDTMGD